MKIEAKNVEDYFNNVPEERKVAMNKLRQIILVNLPEGFSETLSYGMPSYVVPLSLYPDGYHCKKDTPLPFVSVASQKNFIAVYHMGMYANKDLYDWFVEEYGKRCKYKLDMGKSCVRMKKIEDIPFDLIGELMQKMTSKEWIDIYESNFLKH